MKINFEGNLFKKWVFLVVGRYITWVCYYQLKKDHIGKYQPQMISRCDCILKQKLSLFVVHSVEGQFQ